MFLIRNSFYKKKDGNNKDHKLKKKMKHFNFVIYIRKCKIVFYWMNLHFKENTKIFEIMKLIK